jgi:NADP-dependent 3-hydroxy acid dehydrogenase YdfG
MSTEAVAHTVMFMLSLPSDVLVEELVLTKFFGVSA